MSHPSSVAYMWHKDYTKESDAYIPTTNRNDMVHSLIEAYDLLDHVNLVVPKKAANQDLETFHSADYLACLEGAEPDDVVETPSSSEEDDFGLEYDCPKKDGIMEYCHRVAGGTLEAAKLLNSELIKTAIHWLGGWHHAQRSSAAGYCYINDCVLGIIELRKRFQHVLYVDIDLHHGDGVEDAFCATDKVTTLSFHKYEPGFFPGTGCTSQTGFGKGKYYTVNVPLLDGIRDQNYCKIFDTIFKLVHEKFKPDAILCQCGADGMNEDPMRSFNLTQKSMVHCVKEVLELGLPTLLVGGGGYHPANTARCWASVTADVLGLEISQDIPEHGYFAEYGPHFELSIPEGCRKDMNTEDYVKGVVGKIVDNLSTLP